MVSLEENLKNARERIEKAALQAGRDPSEITIVAVTKTHGPEVVEEAVAAGLLDVGENKVQEFLEKSEKVSVDCKWHFIGHLQRNKVKKIIGRFELIHGVDSLRLARRINNLSLREGIVSDILIQVNTSGEESKFGIEPDEVEKFCGEASGFEGIKVRGLMTMAPWVDDTSVIARTFKGLRLLSEKLRRQNIENISMEHLSMGMTDDFEIAIAEGSTILRLGRVLFGPRNA
ncbi:MAG TPA: YggS family pyridoxal phosphate-dependent enzyme [Candidatus Krumholzibacteriaceae bacterium]|nr:YggS family pyridoxal phosphate-dependent enzyme [Candidatus Krumholzibacteriaceae bacterium]